MFAIISADEYICFYRNRRYPPWFDKGNTQKNKGMHMCSPYIMTLNIYVGIWFKKTYPN